MNFLKELEDVLKVRKIELPEKSYTSKLFREGEDRILKKVLEEAGEVAIASKNHDREELTHESADLIFHLLVLLVHEGIPFENVVAELEKRHR